MKRIIPTLLIVPAVLLAACGAKVETVTIEAATNIVAPDDDLSVTATATYDDGTTENVTADATWASADAAVATVAAGTVTGVAAGDTTITATFDEVESAAFTIEVGCHSDTMVDVSGTAAIHPVSLGIDPTLTLENTSVTLGNPTLALAGRNPALFYQDCTPASTMLTSTTAAGTENWAFTAVNTKAITLGAIVIMGGTGYELTSMGFHSGPLTEDVTGARSFIVSTATEGALATLGGMSPGDLSTAGWILGTFVSPLGAPVGDVTLVDDTGAPIPGTIYPNDTFTGTGTATAATNGVFVVSGLGLGTYAGDHASLTCASQQAATSPDQVFLVFLTCE